MKMNDPVFLGLIGIVILLVCFWIYFLPTIIARNSHHPNTFAIFLVNLFFGYTALGWLIALIWACMGKPQPQQMIVYHQYQEPPKKIQVDKGNVYKDCRDAV